MAERIPRARWVRTHQPTDGPDGACVVLLRSITAIVTIDSSTCAVRSGGLWYTVDRNADELRQAVDEAE